MTSLVLCLLLADTLRPGVVVQDEGVRRGRAGVVNCVGTGVVCSLSAGVWTIDASGGGGGAPTTATYVTQTCDAGLSAEQCLSALGTGILKSTTGTGILSIAAGADLPAHQHAGGDVTSAVASATAASTAGAFSADPADCVGAGEFAKGVSASGVASGCAVPPGTYSLPALQVGTLGGVKGRAGTTLACAGTDKATGFDAAGALLCSTDLTGAGVDLSAEPFVTSSTSANLSAERVLLAGTNTTIDTSTAGQIKVNVATGAGYVLPDAAAGAKGGLELDTDLGGTAAAPQVVATHLAAALPGAQGGVGVALPTCSGTDKLTANGTQVSCATDQTGGGGGVVALASDVGANSTTLVQTWPAITFTANKTNIIDGVYIVTTANASTGTPRPGILTGGFPTGTVCQFEQVTAAGSAAVQYVLTAANTATGAGTAPGTYNHVIPFWCVCTGASCNSTTLKLAIASEGAIQVYAKAGSFYRQQTLP